MTLRHKRNPGDFNGAKQMNMERPSAYTFAKAIEKRQTTDPRESGRRGVVIFWLAYMPARIAKQWGDNELTDAEILKMAHEMKLPGTGPWLQENA